MRLEGVKRCSLCGELKPESEFYQKAPGKLFAECKMCNLARTHRYQQSHREEKVSYDREYRVAHKEQTAAAKRKYRDAHIEQIAEYRQNYYVAHQEQIKVRKRKFRADHRQEHLAYNCRWRELHPEQAAEQSRRYYLKHTGAVKVRVLRYRAANPEKRTVLEQRRRARKRGNGGTFTEEEWQELCNALGNKCQCCGAEGKLTVDHIVPLSMGGSNSIDNLQPLCKSCNCRKHTRVVDYRYTTEVAA